MSSDFDEATVGHRHWPLPERTSEVLEELAKDDGERITFGEILSGLRHRAFGFAMLVFALPCSLPMPPGIPTICGVALVVIAFNLITLRKRLWLPKAIAAKSIERADLQRIIGRALPAMRRVERFCRPRWPVVTESFGKVLIGIVVFVLGFIMILPIPLIGNMPPGFAASFIAVGVAERDGLIVLIGLVISAGAIALASAATWAAVLGLLNLL
jgi:hypothetical protein